MRRKTVDVAVIIPDASQVLTLAGIGRIDLLDRFSVPVPVNKLTRPSCLKSLMRGNADRHGCRHAGYQQHANEADQQVP